MNKYNMELLPDFTVGGIPGELEILPCPVTVLGLRNLGSGEELEACGKDFAHVSGDGNEVNLESPFGIGGISVKVRKYDVDDEIHWKVSVTNQSTTHTVTYVDYPHLVFKGEHFNGFLPKYGGLVEENIIERGFFDPPEEKQSYPCGFYYTMPYFAFYNESGGVYAGVHDEKGALKRFGIITDADKKTCEFIARYPAENIGSANSFEVAGDLVWKSFKGDWYDATMIYADFVYSKAQWLPERNRPDSDSGFRSIPLWIMDWLPNAPDDPDPLPESVRPKIPNPDPDNWYKGAIEFAEEIGVPIGYHLYNWHQIPFNNDYPHYFPEKAGVREGIEKLKEKGITVMPYINGKLWDVLDRGAEDFEFSEIAKKWAVKKDDGSVFTEQHAAHEKNGDLCTLAIMCPTATLWHDKISDTVGRLYRDLGVDGVYLDQIAASIPRLCTDTSHDHLPGGGVWWIEGYNAMLERLRKEKPDYGFFTTECNAEPFMKGFDGYLTWIWLQSNSVPAFSAIYSPYITLFGRNTNGKKADDTPFFKSNLAMSLLAGQQLGWIAPAVREDPEKLGFMKKLAHVRYKYTDLFNCGTLLRPPKVQSDIADTITTPAMSFTEEYTVKYVQCGGWRSRDGRVYVFVINLSETSANAHIEIASREYGFDEDSVLRLKDGICKFKYELQGEQLVADMVVNPDECAIFEICKQK